MKTFQITTVVTIKDDLVNELNLAGFVEEAMMQVLVEGDTLKDVTVSLMECSND